MTPLFPKPRLHFVDSNYTTINNIMKEDWYSVTVWKTANMTRYCTTRKY